MPKIQILQKQKSFFISTYHDVLFRCRPLGGQADYTCLISPFPSLPFLTCGRVLALWVVGPMAAPDQVSKFIAKSSRSSQSPLRREER